MLDNSGDWGFMRIQEDARNTHREVHIEMKVGRD